MYGVLLKTKNVPWTGMRQGTSGGPNNVTAESKLRAEVLIFQPQHRFATGIYLTTDFSDC